MANKKIMTQASCDHSSQCFNNNCVFRLQSFYGLKYLQPHEGIEEVLTKAGVSYAEYPKLELKSMPAGIFLVCIDFKEVTDEHQ